MLSSTWPPLTVCRLRASYSAAAFGSVVVGGVFIDMIMLGCGPAALVFDDRRSTDSGMCGRGGGWASESKLLQMRHFR